MAHGNADRLRGIGADPLIDEAPFIKLVCNDSPLPQNPYHCIAAALCIADCVRREEQLKKKG